MSELLDLRNFITISMTVGPASGVLKGVPEAEWRPMDVALTVLIDRWGGGREAEWRPMDVALTVLIDRCSRRQTGSDRGREQRGREGGWQAAF